MKKITIGIVAVIILVAAAVLVSGQTNSKLKTYSDNSISFEYPSALSVKNDAGAIVLSHSIPHKHPNPCDFKGDSPPLENLTDFFVSLKVVNQNLKNYVQSSQYPGWDYVSTNPYTYGSLNGYKVQSGVEGCGAELYYFTISPDKTLFISRSFVPELNPIIGDYKANLELPGIIPPNQADEFFTKLLSTVKVK